MKMIITDKDIRFMLGKFAIELEDDIDTPGIDGVHQMIKDKMDFYMEKRIFFISAIHDREETEYIFSGRFYQHGRYNREEFIEKFNNPSSKGRHNRLLTNDELDLVFKYMKDNQY